MAGTQTRALARRLSRLEKRTPSQEEEVALKVRIVVRNGAGERQDGDTLMLRWTRRA